MKIATAAEMRAMDAAAIGEYKIPGIVLMENAGNAVARVVGEYLGGVRDKKICIIAGKGNNGGDGYVAARQLYNQGARIKVFLIGCLAEDLTGDARTNMDILIQMGISITPVAAERDWDIAELAFSLADCLVDALLGTGIYGELKPEFRQAVELVNKSGRPVVAVDIPSGVEADTGQIRTTAVRAIKTVTLGLFKPGLLLYPGAEYAGEVVTANIGIPVELLENPAIKQNWITAEQVGYILPKRKNDAHKGTAGRVTVVAGSRGLTGAAALASMAALRAGAGLVTLCIAASLNNIMEVKLTEVMTCPLPDRAGDGCLTTEAAAAVVAAAGHSGVLAIGPGLGTEEETQMAVRQILLETETPLVIDADALSALAGQPELWQDLKALAVLTPHPGEMARLTGLTSSQVNADRIAVARQAAGEWGCIIVLKGAPTVVAFPDGEVYLNSTGNAGMATGGTGDVLTGIIAGLIAQGLSSHEAAVAGVFVHGRAGDFAAENGKIGLVAGDLLQMLPKAISG